MTALTAESGDHEPPRRPGGRGADRGRPRDPAVDESIITATIELLGELGYDGLTVAAVASRAGVSKPALYRRWAEKSQLVVEAMATRMPVGPLPDTGDTAADLLVHADYLVTLFGRTPAGRVLPGLVSAMDVDPGLAESYRRLIVEPTRQRWRIAVERGIARGDLDPGTDVAFLLDAATGPLFVRLLITGEPIGPGLAQSMVELVLARFGIRPDLDAGLDAGLEAGLDADRRPNGPGRV
jgi:AcrR family transcriptional regulator